MTDIVERLREEDQLDRDSEMEELLHGEAADEIELLRQALVDSDNLEEQLMFRIQDQEAEIAALKQQLEETQLRAESFEGSFNACEKQLANTTKALNAAKVVIASKDKVMEFEAIKYRQADEAISTLASEREANAILTQQLAECHAREKVLRDELGYFVHRVETGSIRSQVTYTRYKNALAMPSGSTALDQAIKQAKREALLEAADWLVEQHGRKHEPEELRRMAKELE